MNLALGVLLGIGSAGSSIATEDQQTQQEADKMRENFNRAIKKIDEALPGYKVECKYFIDKQRCENVARKFMRSLGVDCARRIFEGWKNLESKPSFCQNKNKYSNKGIDDDTQEKLTARLVTQAGELLYAFSINDEDCFTILEALVKAREDDSLRWFNGMDDPDLKEEKYSQHSCNTFGNGNFFGINRMIFFGGTLDANDPDGALVIMMHEIGHAYDCLKYGKKYWDHGEHISILFELLTALSSPKLFEAYLNSTLFFMRALRYLPCVFMDKVLNNLNSWKWKFDANPEKRKELVAEVMRTMIKGESDDVQKYIMSHSNAKAILEVFAARILGFMNSGYKVDYAYDFVSKDIGKYTEPFVKAYQLLMDPRSQGKSLNQLCNLLIKGSEINFDDLKNVNINLKK